MSADGKTIQFETSLTAGDPSTTAALNAVPAVRTAAAAVVPTLHATDYGVAGEAPALYDISSISNSDLAHVIPIAIIVIGVLLALVMRSLIAPLYLIASVALSYFAALGLAVLIFIELGDGGGITFILPFLLFIFLLALGEDYNILVMTQDPGGGAPPAAAGGGLARRRRHRHHGHLGRPGAGRHVRGVRVVGGSGSGGGQIARRRRTASRSASSWTRSWSAPCSCRARWCCSAGGTGGRRSCSMDAPAAGTDAVGASADALGLSEPRGGQDGQSDASTDDSESRRKS